MLQLLPIGMINIIVQLERSILSLAHTDKHFNKIIIELFNGVGQQNILHDSFVIGDCKVINLLYFKYFPKLNPLIKIMFYKKLIFVFGNMVRQYYPIYRFVYFRKVLLKTIEPIY